MVNNSSPESKPLSEAIAGRPEPDSLASCDSRQTSIIISTVTRDNLKACKHGGNTYDDVINKLLQFHHRITGTIIVE